MRSSVSFVVFVLLAFLVISPFRTTHEFVTTDRIAQTPAGELVSGTRLVQKGHFPSSKVLGITRQHLCFGIQFATYNRRNKGQLEVAWKQNGNLDRWLINSRELDDNEFRYFCPKKGMTLNSDFYLSLSSSGASSGRAPTVWLTPDTRFGCATINGGACSKSLTLSLATHRIVTIHHIASMDHGGYFFGWLMSLAIGLAALVLLRQDEKNPPTI